MHIDRWIAAAILITTACGGREDPIVIDAGVDSAVDVCEGRSIDAPSARSEAGGIYDPMRGRMIVYGGNLAAPVDCRPMVEITDEVWALATDCATWERVPTTGGPGPRARHVVALDAARDRMLMFGGRDRANGAYRNYADAWALDLASAAWTRLETSGTGPSPRSSATLVVDEARGRALVFGGNVSADGLVLTGADDLFALDLTTLTWSELPSGPSRRLYHSAVLVGDRMIVYGGTPTFDGPFDGDVWALDLATDTWERLHDGTGDAPTARFGGELFADPTRNRVLLAMGHDAGPPVGPGALNDVWAFDLAARAWTRLHEGDVLDNASAGLCDFPPDFTTIEAGAPERRYSFVHTQSMDRGLLFGGKTDCGNIADVWELELANGRWMPRRAATGGEACLRSGRVNCTSLCF